jgi:hypothetical protein
MLRYSSNRNTIERRHHFLWQPYILVPVSHFAAAFTVSCSSHKSELLSGT